MIPTLALTLILAAASLRWRAMARQAVGALKAAVLAAVAVAAERRRIVDRLRQ